MTMYMVTLYRMVGEYAEFEVEAKDQEEAISRAELTEERGGGEWRDTGSIEMEPDSYDAVTTEG